MRVHYQRNHLGMMAIVFALMAITLYMAFAFPYSLLLFKQSETTEIKAVIIVGRHGEVTPARETYFDALGEEPPERWFQLGGPSQLTSVGVERMYLLGKFLRLRYYDSLLAGNPRKLFARSENSDEALESAQALLAGLNPPRDKWIWSRNADSDHELAASWQPKAVHTTHQSQDDLLGSQSKCLQMDTFKATWKNSSRYSQLLNEFRHDLQILRQNTGFEFEDDLEMLANIEDQLRARSAFDGTNMPVWYTDTFAQRLAHIAYVTAGCRFGQAGSQQLFAGRLLDTIVKSIFSKIRSDLTAGISLLNDNDANDELIPLGADFNSTDNGRQTEGLAHKNRLQLPLEEQIRLKLERHNEPNMFIYMTDKLHLTALMNSLKIYSSQPHYGATLIIELHYDPANQVHFLRLFLVNSASYNVLPEPVRVNPIACLDSAECSPQQFDKNIRHQMLDKQAWSSLCATIDKFDHEQMLQQLTSSTTTAGPPATGSPIESTTRMPTSTVSDSEPVGPTDRSDKATTETIQTTASSIDEAITPSLESDLGQGIHLDKLDENLLVGPTIITITANETNESTNQSKPAKEPIESTAIIQEEAVDLINPTTAATTTSTTTTPTTTTTATATDADTDTMQTTYALSISPDFNHNEIVDTENHEARD